MLITYVLVLSFLLTTTDTDGKCGLDGALCVGEISSRFTRRNIEQAGLSMFVGTSISWPLTRSCLNAAAAIACLTMRTMMPLLTSEAVDNAWSKARLETIFGPQPG